MSILIGFLCVLLASFLLLARSERTRANRFLAVFLLLSAIELSAWLWVTESTQGHWTNTLRIALGKLQMPVFLGFYLASCYADFRLRWRDGVHMLPLMLSVILILPGDQTAFWTAQSSQDSLAGREPAVFVIGSHLLYYGYMVGVGWVLWQFWRQFRAQHSGAPSETLIWLTQLALASVFAHTLVLIRDLLRLSPAYELVLILQMIGALIALAIVTWIALKSLLHPKLFRTVDRRLTALAPSANTPSEQEMAMVTRHMAQAQPYLDADLTLARLADQLALTPRELSERLNQSGGQHFFDFINRYRIEHAKRLLIAPEAPAIIDVLHDSGFNSKSSFNTAFKKHTGLTPSAFRKENITTSTP